jgi:CheY-like chemotaxis protein
MFLYAHLYGPTSPPFSGCQGCCVGYVEVYVDQTSASLPGGSESKKYRIAPSSTTLKANDVRNRVEHFLLPHEGRSQPLALKHEIDISGRLRPSQPDQPVILVADDEVAIRNIARLTLEEAGYFVLTAGDGEQALDLSRGFHGTIHVLVSDVMMPKLDGMALREQILRERPTVKVLLMSGSTGRPLEGVAFLPKPFETGQLEQRVQELVQT